MRVPGTRKARPAPAVNGAGLAEMPTGRRRWATAPLTGTSSGQTRPPVPGDHPRRSPAPRTPILPPCPVPLPVPAGSSCDFRRNLWGGLR